MPENEWQSALVQELIARKYTILNIDTFDNDVTGQPSPDRPNSMEVKTRYQLPLVIVSNTSSRDAQRKTLRNAQFTVPVTNRRRLTPGDVITMPDGYEVIVDSVESNNPSGTDYYYEVSASG